MKRKYNSELKQLLVSLVGNTPFGIVTIGFKGEISMINQQAADILDVELPVSKLLNLSLLDFFDKDSKFSESISNMLRKGRGEKDFPQESYHEKILSLRVRPFINGLLITIEDITNFSRSAKQLQRRKEELEFKNNELEQFAYIASHDLQEPLNTVRGFINLIRLKGVENIPEEYQGYFNHIEQSAQRMSSQLSGLLEYSRIGKHGVKEEHKLHEIFQEVQDDMKNQISESNAELIFHEMPASILGVKPELMSLFRNLIGNALKYVHKGVTPKVEISCKLVNEFQEFAIKDNGIGIAPEFQAKIFVIYQRLFNKSQYPGDGIGLAHCKKIVELHGGKIWVESTVEEGSTFYFTIKR